MQEFWIPVDSIPDNHAKPSTKCDKILLPKFCPTCSAWIDIDYPGNKDLGGGLLNPCSHAYLYEYLWSIRITTADSIIQNINNLSGKLNKSSGGFCTGCNLFNEYQAGSYTCYYCRNRA